MKAWTGPGSRLGSFVDITTGGTTDYGGGIRGGAAAAVGVLSRPRVEFRNRWRSEAAKHQLIAA